MDPPARWSKQGLVVDGTPEFPWRATHAMVPFVHERADGTLQLYFSTRDEEGRSVTVRGDLFLDEGPAQVVLDPRPVLGPGALGAFDDRGAMGSCLVEDEGRLYLYYIGWTVGQTVPFYTFIGCAVSENDGATFERVSQAPVVERGPHDPFLTTSPWVLVEDGRWRLWYTSGTGWTREAGTAKHQYHVRYAESRDGIRWDRRGQVCIDYEDDDYAIARPCVLRDPDRYRMWFSHRGESYRIGYAESSDGVDWRRSDAGAGIDVSPDGWDAEMIEYAVVFDRGGVRHMLYNGNGYGQTGIGHAILHAR